MKKILIILIVLFCSYSYAEYNYDYGSNRKLANAIYWAYADNNKALYGIEGRPNAEYARRKCISRIIYYRKQFRSQNKFKDFLEYLAYHYQRKQNRLKSIIYRLNDWTGEVLYFLDNPREVPINSR